MFSFIALICKCAALNLLLEPENYTVVSDYHSPVQQPCFSGALKVTRVEQMAQFPQSFWINESLLQRNANFQTLDCFLKQEWGRKKNISFSHFRNSLNMPCTGIPQSHRMLPLHNESLIGFGVLEQLVSMWKMCTIAMKLHNFLFVALWYHCIVMQPSSIKKLKYFVGKNSNPVDWKPVWQLSHVSCIVSLIGNLGIVIVLVLCCNFKIGDDNIQCKTSDNCWNRMILGRCQECCHLI